LAAGVACAQVRPPPEAYELEHDPEKWAPVFRKDHAQTKGWSAMTIRRKVITL
jgi:hypothetical protein